VTLTAIGFDQCLTVKNNPLSIKADILLSALETPTNPIDQNAFLWLKSIHAAANVNLRSAKDAHGTKCSRELINMVFPLGSSAVEFIESPHNFSVPPTEFE
jgi:hypothetical protein